MRKERKPLYEPTSEEIRERAWAIQAEWTDDEERKRRVAKKEPLGTRVIRVGSGL